MSQPAPLPDHLRLPATRRFQLALALMVARSLPAMHRAWDGLDGYDEEVIESFTNRTAATVNAVKSGAVRTALGYYVLLAGVRAVPVEAGEVDTVPDLRAPFISVWQAFSSGNTYEDALAAGRTRIEAVVTDFAVSSARKTGDVFVNKAGLRPHGWERIPDAGACAWCRKAASERYSSADAADFGHNRCGCTAAPAF